MLLYKQFFLLFEERHEALFLSKGNAMLMLSRKRDESIVIGGPQRTLYGVKECAHVFPSESRVVGEIHSSYHGILRDE